MRYGVLGAGAVGARAVRQLAATPDTGSVRVADVDDVRAERVATAIAGTATAVPVPSLLAETDLDAVVLAMPAPHAPVAEQLLRRGLAVVSVSDDASDVAQLLRLGVLADDRDTTLVVGAAFAPGLSCLLARHASRSFDRVDELHVAKHGTGGPACARQHHDALAGTAIEWRAGGWRERPAGSGRELCWFPDPIGPLDCYRAGLPDPVLLHAAFAGVERITARLSATRRDRLTARLPMLRPPHPEGGLSAIRVEVRGERDGSRAVEVLGAVDRAGIAVGAVAAVAAVAVAAPRRRFGACSLGDAALATDTILADLAHRGVKAARFVGQTTTSATW